MTSARSYYDLDEGKRPLLVDSRPLMRLVKFPRRVDYLDFLGVDTQGHHLVMRQGLGLYLVGIPTMEDVMEEWPLTSICRSETHDGLMRSETIAEGGGRATWTSTALEVRNGESTITTCDLRCETLDIIDTFQGAGTEILCLASKGRRLAAKVSFMGCGSGAAIFFYEYQSGHWECTHTTRRQWSARGTMAFTSDGEHLAMLSPWKRDITVMRCSDGEVVRRFQLSLPSPYYMTEFEGGWLVVDEPGQRLVFVDETREVCVCRFLGCLVTSGGVVLMPGVGPAVATDDGLLCVINGWDVLTARMSEERVAWMATIARLGTRK